MDTRKDDRKRVMRFPGRSIREQAGTLLSPDGLGLPFTGATIATLRWADSTFGLPELADQELRESVATS